MTEIRKLNLGILGCGPISQAAHLESACKAKNVRLMALCDAAPGLLQRATEVFRPIAFYTSFDQMLQDPKIDAVLIAVHDKLHVALAKKAIAAGKHILIEKPLGITVAECEELRQYIVPELTFAIGNNRRFEPGMMAAKKFIQEEIGEIVSFNSWYYDSRYRYTVQDNLYPIPFSSSGDGVVRPDPEWKSDRQRYNLITHGPHLFDTARHLAGPIVALSARHTDRGNMRAWAIHADFEQGFSGYLELICPRAGDFQEGYKIEGTNGHINGRSRLPWYQLAEVEIFKTSDGAYHRPLGEDGDTFRRQLEAFADSCLNGTPLYGACLEDGIATVKALIAVAHSVRHNAERVFLDDVDGDLENSTILAKRPSAPKEEAEDLMSKLGV